MLGAALKALSQPGLPRQDIQRLGLEVEVDKQRKKTGCLSTTNFELPEDLPSVEEQLKRLELEVVVRQIQQTTTSNELPSVEEEKQLRDLVDAKASLEVIMAKLHKSVDAVQKKCVRLGLEVDGDAKKSRRRLLLLLLG